MGLEFWASVLFLVLNAYFVLMEFALVRVHSATIEILVRRGNRRALLVQQMLGRLDTYLSAIQIGITMASLGLGWVAEPAVAFWLAPYLESLPWTVSKALSHGLSFGLAFAFITFMHVVFGDLIPRSIGIQKAEFIALWFALPLEAYYRVFKIPIDVMAWCSMWVLRLMKFHAVGGHEHAFSEDELRLLMGASHEKGLMPLERVLLIENLLDFGSLRAKDAMTARDKIAFLDLGRSWEENLRVFRERRFSRYPVCEGGLDRVAGWIHIKDLPMGPAGEPPDLGRIKREPLFTKETESLSALFKLMAGKGRHMALVRDGSDKVIGLVTLEDILEEIVGEIRDEYEAQKTWTLKDLVLPGAVELQLQADAPPEVIRALLERLRRADSSLSLDGALEAVSEREAKLSTGIGRGLAVPHARLASLSRPIVAVGRGVKPISFSSPDNVPVRLIFLILTPLASPMDQIRILSRIASIASNETARRRLLRVKSPEHFLEILHTAESVLTG